MQLEKTAPPAATWGVREIVLSILLFGVPLGALIVVARLANLGALIPANLRPVLGSLGLLAFEGLLVAPVWLMAIALAHGSWRALGFRGFDAALGCTLPITYLFFAYVLSFMWGAVLYVTRWPTQPRIAPIFGDNPAAIAIGFVAAALVAPIAEETFFRGFMLGGLRQRFGAMGALLISSTFFALLHQPITIFPVIFVLGLMLGLLWLQTGSIWPGIFMHATFNMIGFLAQFIVPPR